MGPKLQAGRGKHERANTQIQGELWAAGQARGGHGTAWQVLPTGVRGLELALPRAAYQAHRAVSRVGDCWLVSLDCACPALRIWGNIWIHWTFLEFGYLNLTFLGLQLQHR